jgi:hypothetical protein
MPETPNPRIWPPVTMEGDDNTNIPANISGLKPTEPSTPEIILFSSEMMVLLPFPGQLAEQQRLALAIRIAFEHLRVR